MEVGRSVSASPRGGRALPHQGRCTHRCNTRGNRRVPAPPTPPLPPSPAAAALKRTFRERPSHHDDEVQTTTPTTPNHHRYIPFDARIQESCKDFVESATSPFGRLDHAVNAFGVAPQVGPILVLNQTDLGFVSAEKVKLTQTYTYYS